MASFSDTEVVPGQLLAGKFRIERILGRGGMGVVGLATHIHLDEQVAIKFLLPEALKVPEAVRRFEREARAAVKIKSEHVARVTDVGTLDTGSPYMVMEYLSGVDLSQYLLAKRSLPVDEAIDYVLQAIEAIGEAHSLGIVHRDLKPANLFRILRPDGSPSIKVLDFGISKVGGPDASMTQTSSMMGSPYYMSPEQMTSSKSVDARTDVWALGVILYELLSGRVPYEGDTVPEIVAQVLQNPPPPVGRKDVPRELERVVMRTLSKDREARYADVAALAVALAPFGPAHARNSVQRVSRVLGLTIDATLPDGAAQRPADAPDAHADTTFGGASRTDLNLAPIPLKKSYRTMLALGLTLLTGAVGFVAYTWVGADPSTPHAEAPSNVDSVPPRPEPATQAKAEVPAAAQPPVAQPPAAQAKAPADAPVDPAAPAPNSGPLTTKPPASSTRPSRPSGAPATDAAPPATVPAPEPSRPAPPTPPRPPRAQVDLFSDRK
jgi:eukaryotic-like serine/threonine-protein kinase